MEQSTSAGDSLGIIFWFIIFLLVMFVLPAWLMWKHHKKSTAKIERQRKEAPKLTPEEERRQWHEGHKRAVRVVSTGGGAYLGVALFGLIGGLVLAIIFGLIGSAVADLIWGNGKDN